MQLIGELAQARDINYPLDKSSQVHVYLSYKGNEKQKTVRLSWTEAWMMQVLKPTKENITKTSEILEGLQKKRNCISLARDDA